jgi:protein-S-isoprenylcysteine O-methyltransferase Ste14
MSLWKQLRAIFFLPVMVMVIVPALIVFFGGINFAWGLAAPWLVFVTLSGGLCIAAGLWLFAQTVPLLVREGQGTLAPWDPPRRLVVRGIYRHVRNPMISGVMSVLLGEMLWLGSVGVLIWSLFFVLANGLYIPRLEERDLEKRFGADYVLYKKHVPRWIPRRTAWELPDGGESVLSNGVRNLASPFEISRKDGSQ